MVRKEFLSFLKEKSEKIQLIQSRFVKTPSNNQGGAFKSKPIEPIKQIQEPPNEIVFPGNKVSLIQTRQKPKEENTVSKLSEKPVNENVQPISSKLGPKSSTGPFKEAYSVYSEDW
jgi:hypothetical protein